MAKLYLIRRNMESFAGPMTLVEMKDAYKRMTFGLQDEVSGHCGPWVAFDDLTKLKKSYPDVAKVVHEDMLSGWGVSDHHDSTSGGNDETRRVAKSSSSSRTASRRHLGLAIVFLVVAVVAFAAAVYLAAPLHMSGKSKDDAEPEVPEVDEAQALINAGNLDGFKQYVTQNQAQIVPQVIKSKKAMNDWLPYLRLQAFAVSGATGEVPGLVPKFLRGPASNAAPVDCSEKIWRRRFRASAKQWGPLVAGRGLVRMHWARLLAWDPHWIQRRESSGWIEPRNYYIGCLMMADRALANIALETASPTASNSGIAAPGQPLTAASDVDKVVLDKLRIRVQWLLEVARDGRSSLQPVFKSDDLLSQWSCFEAASELKELNRCRDAVASGAVAEDWATYSEERYNWNVLRLALAQRKSLAPDLATLISNVAGKLNKADFLTGFDYRAEQKLAKLLASQSPADKTLEKTADKSPDKSADRALDKSLDKLETEFPEFKLSH